ncbi:hypothetical protein LSH36_215g03007 [Paralvinella palmiformis]|uniref:Intraflagellar transport protein 81 homolog n=1 Tax=Paralvinella palmiformis TaxID=53620 RepID=A0AAD9N629_9ANNE|nr:hypothetical protein LSH36_215g03007 [Paralvinella palmiformis]
MSHQLKYIVQELNKPPFNRNYNLISIDSLEPLQLLQVLTDVLAEVDPKQRIDVREEAPEQTAIRIFSSLRILKYKPPTDSQNMSSFRQGIVQGDKLVIYPILEWLLKRIPDLKKRAYLARFLVKVEVPPDFMAEEDIADMYAQYSQLIDEFKEMHKEAEALKTSGFNTADIKKDITSMEDEKEQLLKRIDRLKKKVEAAPNSGPMLAVARNLRQERDREEKLTKQKHEQKNLLGGIYLFFRSFKYEQRIQRLNQQIKDTKQASIGATPEGLFKRLEEELKVNEYMVKEKFPKEIEMRKKAVTELQRIVAEPAMGQADLGEIKNKIDKINSEVNQLIEKRMMSGDPMDDKISLFRQQAAIIARKKEAAAETLHKVREELSQANIEVEEKRGLAKQGDGEEILKGEEFKLYVNKLRTKSTIYKKKRQEIAELRAETGVLSRTLEIIRLKDEQIDNKLNALEGREGVSGYRETQEALESVSAIKSELDQMKGRTLEDISQLVQQLTKKISEKKEALAPTIKELRILRTQGQEIDQVYNEKKMAYDNFQAGLESNRAKLEQEVKILRDEVSMQESRFHYLNAMYNICELQQTKISAEMKLYVSSDPYEKKKSLREQYSRKLQEQENLGKGLREKQKYVRENQPANMQQMKMWRDLERLMECKMRLAQSRSSRAGSARAGGQQGMQFPEHSAVDEERLVL